MRRVSKLVLLEAEIRGGSDKHMEMSRPGEGVVDAAPRDAATARRKDKEAERIAKFEATMAVLRKYVIL